MAINSAVALAFLFTILEELSKNAQNDAGSALVKKIISEGLCCTERALDGSNCQRGQSDDE